MVKENKTPLMVAAEFTKSPAVVDLLLKAEADVNATARVSVWKGDSVRCYIYIYKYIYICLDWLGCG